MKAQLFHMLTRIWYTYYRVLIRFAENILCYFKYARECLFLRPFILISFGGFSGAFIGMYFSVLHGIVLLLVLLVACAISVAKKKIIADDKKELIILICSLLFCTYCFAYIGIGKFTAGQLLERHTSEGEYDQKYEGVIVKRSGRFDDTEGGHSYVMVSENAVRITFYSERLDLKTGQYVSVTGRICEQLPERNPGGFDYKEYYARQGIYLSLKTTDRKISVKNEASAYQNLFDTILNKGSQLRIELKNAWDMVMDDHHSAVLAGMLLGDKSWMSERQKDNFRMCNLSHLIAVSGIHVSHFLVPLVSGIRRLGKGRKSRQLMIAAFLVFFGFLTGWTASVSRAILMTLGGIVCSFTGRRYDSIGGLFAASFLLLFVNPYFGADLGFLLSFSATLSILLFAGKTSDSLIQIHFPSWLARGAACMISAQIGMMPILVMMSVKQSWILLCIALTGSFMSQAICLLAIPITFAFMILRWIPFAVNVFSFIYAPITGLIFSLEQISVIGAYDSIGAIRLGNVNPILLIGLCSGILILCLPKSSWKKIVAKLVIPFIVFGGVFQWVDYCEKPVATIVFIDVGQGDSALIMADGKSVLIDGGDVGKGQVVSSVLSYYGIYQTDITLLTHLHSDHGVGLLELVEENRVDEIGTSCTEKNDEYYNLVEGFDIDGVFYELRKNDRIKLCDKVELLILSPAVLSCGGGNEDSLILFLLAGDSGILFMGDAGESTETSMLSDSDVVELLKTNSVFLKVGHHGSKFSTTDEFLLSQSLVAAVISVGNNFYGHPADETIDRLQTEKIDVYRTDRNGAVILNIYEDRFEVKTMM